MLLDDQTHQIFGIAESRLDLSVDSGLINIPGYSAIRQDRNRAGGGILLYVHNKFKAKVLYCSQTTMKEKPMKTEYLFCTVRIVPEGNSPPPS